MPVEPPDRIVVRVAARQHGTVTTAQLAAAGLGRHAIGHRVAIGWLRRAHRGVYLVGPLEAPLSTSMAAVLAYGEGALLTHDPALTRSEAERRLLELIRAARLPPPRTNVRVGRHEVDLHWPDHALVVEVDGYAFHSSRTAFETDRRRDAELTAAGLRVARVTWRQIVGEPEAVVAVLAAALAAQAPPSRRWRSSAVSA